MITVKTSGKKNHNYMFHNINYVNTHHNHHSHHLIIKIKVQRIGTTGFSFN